MKRSAHRKGRGVQCCSLVTCVIDGNVYERLVLLCAPLSVFTLSQCSRLPALPLHCPWHCPLPGPGPPERRVSCTCYVSAFILLPISTTRRAHVRRQHLSTQPAAPVASGGSLIRRTHSRYAVWLRFGSALAPLSAVHTGHVPGRGGV